MHPFGYLFLALTGARGSSEAPRRFLPEEPLPPIDDASIRAWREWARGGGPVTAPGVTVPRLTWRATGIPKAGSAADGRA